MGVFKYSFIFFGLIGIIIAAVATVFEFSSEPRRQEDFVTILRGENALQIAADLKSEGYIQSKLGFMARVVKTGNLKNLKAGVYDLRGLGDYAIIEKMAAGRIEAKTITVIPGWDIRDIAKSLDKAGVSTANNFLMTGRDSILKQEFDFLAVLPEGASLEGYLYPDTYELPDKADFQMVALLMLGNFDKKLTPELRAEIKKQNKNVAEIVTMAAMLEKEVKTLEDKKIVSGILWKRIASGMPLQVDSTLMYFKVSDSEIINKDVDSPYNTYKYGGLPEGPICNPGIESIEAAVYPQESPYWYYLSAKDGTTIFSRNYGDHLINKAKYLQ